MKMHKQFILLIFFFGFFAKGTEVNKNINFLNLSVGFLYDHSLSKEYKGKKLIFEGTYSKKASVIHRKRQNQLRFNPRRVGTGTLVIKDTKNRILQKINIDVRKTSLHKIAKEVSDFLFTIDGIDVKISNNKVIIDGEILLPREMNRIRMVVEEFGKDVRSLVTFSPKAQEKMARLIEEEVGYLTPPDEVSVRVAYNRFILEGIVSSAEQKERAGLIANFYTQFDESDAAGVQRKGIQSVTNLIEIRKPKPQDTRKKIIRVIVHYVELTKAYNKGFAFQWAPIISDNTDVSIHKGGGGAFGIASAITSTISNFFPKLNWAKGFNFARILHNSTLTLEEGVNGTIDVKTQVPYTSRASDGAIITATSNSGITTSITPKIVGPRKDTVHMEVNVSVSSFAGQTNSGAIVNTRSIKTSLHVRSGLSAVLGGLISSNLTKDFNRLPSSTTEGMPIVNLISAKNYDTSKGQFVIFITPIIKSSASSGVDRIKQKFNLDED